MQKRYGMVIDLRRCIGCHTCSVACKSEHAIEKHSWMTVSTVGGVHMDSPAGRYPDLKMDYLPKACMHCAEAPCIEACSSGALYRREDGIVLVGTERCDGCQMCMEACPYAVITFNEQKRVIEKCDFCYERLDEGEEPFCVSCCGMKAMHFGDLNDCESKVSRLIRERGAHPLISERGTKPAVFYLT